MFGLHYHTQSGSRLGRRNDAEEQAVFCLHCADLQVVEYRPTVQAYGIILSSFLFILAMDFIVRKAVYELNMDTHGLLLYFGFLLPCVTLGPQQDHQFRQLTKTLTLTPTLSLNLTLLTLTVKPNFQHLCTSNTSLATGNQFA